MSQITLLFPGQGAQFTGMGQDLCQAYPEAKAVFDLGSQVTGRDLAALCFDGPEEGIARAAATGPARESILKGLEEYGRSGRLTELERQRDNYLISLFKGAKFAEGGIEPLIGYLLGREQEAKCLRLIITAKRNNLPDKVITERLGELYG